MEKFNHPHIVKIIEVEKNGKNKFDIIQEYCELGDLFEFLDKLYN
jgi:serine/threonine protein kinase